MPLKIMNTASSEDEENRSEILRQQELRLGLNPNEREITVGGDKIVVTMHPTYELVATPGAVAMGFGISQDSLRGAKSRNQKHLKEGYHYLKGTHSDLQRFRGMKENSTVWTKVGILKLWEVLTRATKRAADYVHAINQLFTETHP